MKNYRFKTKTACEYARVDRGILNEMIAKGNYAFAPHTTKGATRLFGTVDMIFLIIFGQLMKLGLSARDAADRVSTFYAEIRERVLDHETIVMVRSLDGYVGYLALAEGEKIPTYLSGPGDMVAIQAFNVAAIRRYIEQMGEYEIDNPIVGEDD